MVEVFDIVRTLHIAFAILLAGGTIYHALIVGTFLSRDEAERRAWYAQSKFGPFFGLTGLLMVAFGIWTYLENVGNYAADEMTVLGIGMLLGLGAFAVGFGGHMPVGMKIEKAVKAGDDAEADRLIRADHKLEIVSLVLVGFAVIGMTTFRLFA